VSSEYVKYKTARAGFWPWLSDKTLNCRLESNTEEDKDLHVVGANDEDEGDVEDVEEVEPNLLELVPRVQLTTQRTLRSFCPF